MSFIVANELEISYKEKKVFKSLSFSLPHKGAYALLGMNGSGKTTLLYALAGIIPYLVKADVKGTLKIDGRSPKDFKDKFFVFQDVEDSFIYHTVEDEINQFEEGEKALTLVGLNEKKKFDIFSLSHGEKHRLAIAVALASRSKMLLFDESFSSLDYKSLKAILPMLKNFSRESLLIFSTHSAQLAYEFADDVLVIKEGKLYRGKELLWDKRFSLYPICKKRMFL